MKRAISLLSGILLFAAALAGCAPAGAASVNEPEESAQSLVVVIDAGHGGQDQGAVGASGAREDKLNLAVAKLLAQEFTNAGATVAMTRTGDDVDYSAEGNTQKRRDMNSRAALIKRTNPNAIISIHMNKYPEAKYYGAQTFYWQDNAEGQKLAECIQSELLSGLGGGNKRQIKPGDYFILHVVDAPSALVECGFLSNPEEEKKLQDPAYQRQIAQCIFRGVCAYFGVQ